MLLMLHQSWTINSSGSTCIFQVIALTQQVADAKKKAEEEAEVAAALEEQRKKLSKDIEALHRQLDELRQANDKLDKSEYFYGDM